MIVTVKNEKTDHPTEGAIGLSCGRFMSRKLQLMGVHKTPLGNPHPTGWCPKCQKTHDRASCIEACRLDQDFRSALKTFLMTAKPLLRYRQKVDLWCWCAPEPCHCDLIKIEILEQFDPDQVACVMESDIVLCQACYEEMELDSGDRDPNQWLHCKRPWTSADVCHSCWKASRT